MKTREPFILVALVLVLVTAILGVTYFSTPLWVSASERTAPESQTTRPVEATELANQLTAAQGRIAQLEKASESLTMEERNDFPGLRPALKNMKGIVIAVGDLPLEAVRYGLTKKNVIDGVKARLRTHGIRAVTSDEGLSSANVEDFRIVEAGMYRPSLRVEVEFAPHGATYLGFLRVSMQKHREGGLDNDGGSPEVAKADREWSEAMNAAQRAYEDTQGKESEEAQAAAEKKLDQAFKHAEDMKAKWIQAVKQVRQDFIDGRPPRKPLREWASISGWEQRLSICGALADFAEDERNNLDAMIDWFAGEFLKANPAEAVTERRR
jgi:hypothetical protein